MTWQFVHIPKNGGMSFRKAYRDFERELQPTHDPASSLPEEVRTVAVIRHPLDRLVTICAWFFGSTQPIGDWIDSGDWQRLPRLDIYKRRTDYERTQVACSTPQATWVREETHLIAFDDYQAGLDEWAKMAGYPQRTLERRNKSNREPGWKGYLQDKQLGRLIDYYAEDFELYRRARGE